MEHLDVTRSRILFFKLNVGTVTKFLLFFLFYEIIFLIIFLQGGRPTLRWPTWRLPMCRCRKGLGGWGRRDAPARAAWPAPSPGTRPWGCGRPTPRRGSCRTCRSCPCCCCRRFWRRACRAARCGPARWSVAPRSKRRRALKQTKQCNWWNFQNNKGRKMKFTSFLSSVI